MGLGMDDPIWVFTVLSKNWDRLFANGTVQRLSQTVVEQVRHQALLAEKLFSVHVILLEAWASRKSFQPKERDNRQGVPTVSRRKKCSKDTHASVPDPDCRHCKEAPRDASRLSHLGHVRMDNLHGLSAGEQVIPAAGTAEIDAAEQLIDEPGGAERITPGTDKGYDRQEFIRNLRGRDVTPHVTCQGTGSAIDGRSTRHVWYSIGFRVRMRIEFIVGWMKTMGGGRRKLDSVPRITCVCTLLRMATVYNWARMKRPGVA